jgi:hypothetical protein
VAWPKHPFVTGLQSPDCASARTLIRSKGSVRQPDCSRTRAAFVSRAGSACLSQPAFRARALRLTCDALSKEGSASGATNEVVLHYEKIQCAPIEAAKRVFNRVNDWLSGEVEGGVDNRGATRLAPELLK